MDCLAEDILPIRRALEDWPAVKERWKGFWQHELYDRPLIQVAAPRARMRSPSRTRMLIL